ncbi:MAG TPA: radical SAM protein, partial [Candidatus Udaeobacter sp.]|nr:radical SAM protein [Candidatus Udaeobacter sp.]
LDELALPPEVGTRSHRAAPARQKLDFPLPDRARLPALSHYAHLERNGEVVAAGYVEASRGCKHLCRHCPIPPVYDGRFFVVPADVVLADCAAQIAAGAGHITFGDPDFLNGPGHVLPIVRELHRRHPAVTFDVTVKVEHLLQHLELLPELRALGCAFVVSAVESLSDRVLANLDKGHTRADVSRALAALRAASLPLRPTFVAFTPWTTAADYRDLLAFVESEALIDHVDPVQYALRLLVPPGSPLATDGSLGAELGPLDARAFSYRWTHPDPAMDRLQGRVAERVSAGSAKGEDPMAVFYAVKALAAEELGAVMGPIGPVPSFPAARERTRPPRLTEDWFC